MRKANIQLVKTKGNINAVGDEQTTLSIGRNEFFYDCFSVSNLKYQIIHCAFLSKHIFGGDTYT